MNLYDIAKRATSLSDVMTGRTKMTNKECMEKYPDGVTITSFDFINSNKKAGEKFPVFTIEEDDSVYVNGATVIARVFQEFLSYFDGDIDQANRELKSEGGLPVKFTATKNKAGDDMIAVEIQ